MHIVTIPKGILEPIPVSGGQSLYGGHDYLCTNQFAGSLLTSPWRVVIDNKMWALRGLIKAEYWGIPEFDTSLDWNKLDIWLVRGGGYGDLLMLTPLIRHIRKRWPMVKIHVAAGAQYRGVFIGLGIIDEDIPIDATGLTKTDYVFPFEERIEGHPEAEDYHMAQQFANLLGIDLDGDYKPDYVVTSEEKKWQEETYPRKPGLKRIGLQYMASALYRSYNQMGAVSEILVKQKGVEVCLFGRPGQLKNSKDSPKTCLNLSEDNRTFRESCAVLASCDAVIAPDSAMVHVSAALEIPCLGLYGPFPPHLRRSGNKATTMFGQLPCSPCFFHAQRVDQFPANRPCTQVGICKALAQFTPEEIVEKALAISSPIIQLPSGITLP